MEQHVLAISEDVRTARRCQAVGPSLEQWRRCACVAAGDSGGAGCVVDVVGALTGCMSVYAIERVIGACLRETS